MENPLNETSDFFVCEEVIKMEEKRSLIMGLWKFHERVGNKDLLEVTREWSGNDKYVQLYIRKVSKDQFGIGFTYISDGTKEASERYFLEASDQLKRKFGNDFAGWDISTTDQLIKGF